jgi:hypothetical protein
MSPWAANVTSRGHCRRMDKSLVESVMSSRPQSPTANFSGHCRSSTLKCVKFGYSGNVSDMSTMARIDEFQRSAPTSFQADKFGVRDGRP